MFLILLSWEDSCCQHLKIKRQSEKIEIQTAINWVEMMDCLHSVFYSSLHKVVIAYSRMTGE